MATEIGMTCPHDSTPLTGISVDWKRNTARDRSRHLHVLIDHLARCGDGHEFRITGDLLVESEESVRAQAAVALEPTAPPEVRTFWGRIMDFFTGS